MPLPITAALPITAIPGANPRPGVASQAGGSFGNLLADLMGKVQQTQAQAHVAQVQVVTGQATDLSQAVMASEQATLALELTVQVRNKVLDAYQEIMKMPV